ncbi:Gametolysin peptidase M11 [Fragilaria crotonensis]|nr:Gametolysin peptidase M11 [Fragilaria crotonensis]
MAFATEFVPSWTAAPNRNRIGDGLLDKGDRTFYLGHHDSSLLTVTTVLVLRIEAADKATTASESQLSDDIFGTNGDSLNLKSQFNACSYGQLQFEPLTSNGIVGTDAVYTVSLPTTNVTGGNDNAIAWAAVDKAEADLGDLLTNFADHVVVCMPPGTSGGDWAAYAYSDHWLSVYNDAWCGYPSGLMHEIGHSLNLDHSSEGSEEYGDQSGLMGFSYDLDEEPLMCFNGPKSWQLGWYPDYRVDLTVADLANGINWSGNLVGFAEKASASQTDKMIIRIKSFNDTYINFNRAIGMDAGTQEGQDQVLVTTRLSGTGISLSNLEAKLSDNVAISEFNIPNFNVTSSTLRIKVNSIVTSTTPRASVSIDLIEVPTEAPTHVPTEAPMQAPTRAPTQVPTEAPTQAPTGAPTLAPTG